MAPIYLNLRLDHHPAAATDATKRVAGDTRESLAIRSLYGKWLTDGVGKQTFGWRLGERNLEVLAVVVTVQRCQFSR